jgi:hypothetical protein
MDPESDGKFWHAPSSTKELSDEYEYNEALSPLSRLKCAGERQRLKKTGSCVNLAYKNERSVSPEGGE